MDETVRDQEQAEAYVLRLNGRAWSLAIGTLCGLALFVATIVLVMRGGEDVGSHLGLLSVYFPFYDVTLLGSVIGFAYAFVVGYLSTAILCRVYNRVSGAG